MRNQRTCVAWLVMLAGAVGLATRAGAAGRGWPIRPDGDLLLVQTPHYVLHTDHSPEVAQLIATQQEALFRELYRRMGKIKPTKLTGRFKLKVFKGQARYLQELGPSAIGSWPSLAAINARSCSWRWATRRCRGRPPIRGTTCPAAT